MTKKILIAGSANTTGMNVARALAAADVQFIGCDCSNVNAADMLCSNSVVPRTGDPRYMPALLQIIDEQRVTHVIPTNDHDARAIAAGWAELAARGIIVNGLGKNTLACLDKLETSNLFAASSVPTPPTIDVDDALNRPPFVLRSRTVGGSTKFTHIVRAADVRNSSTIPSEHWQNGIATKFVSGDEFTVDVLCDHRSSEPLAVVPRLRKQISKLGDVHHAELVNDPVVITWAAHAARSFQLVGMNCMQCIVDEHRTPWFFEINPRPGSGMDLTVQGGVNMPKLWLDSLDGRKMEIPEPDWGLQMVRYASARFFK